MAKNGEPIHCRNFMLHFQDRSQFDESNKLYGPIVELHQIDGCEKFERIAIR